MMASVFSEECGSVENLGGGHGKWKKEGGEWERKEGKRGRVLKLLQKYPEPTYKNNWEKERQEWVRRSRGISEVGINWT